MRVVFFGTPMFAVPSIEALISSGHDVVCVVTQPDRARSRSHSTLQPPPVKETALAHAIPVLQPERPRGEEFFDQVRAFRPDLGVVVAYGHLLPTALLAIPRLGMVNVHASLLPRWRGAAPIQWARLSGDRETGVAIMRIEAGLDTGAVWSTASTPIAPEDTNGTLTARLATLGAETLIATLPRIFAGESPTPQTDAGVTHAPKVDRDTARIRWDETSEQIVNRIQAMDPAPGAWCTVHGTETKIFGAAPARARHASPLLDPSSTPLPPPPGTIIADDDAIRVATPDGAITIADVQPAGKKRMRATDWVRGIPRDDSARFS